MLLKHSFQYFFARGIPGIINFASLAVFTRLLSPEEYGQYALVIAGVGLMNAILFQWLRLGLLRYWPSYESKNRSQSFLSTLAVAYLGVVLLTTIIGTGILFVAPHQLRILIFLSISLLWLQAWHEVQLEFSRSKLATRRYSLLMTAKTVLALGIGVILVTLGFGTSGLLIGLGVGLLVPTLIWGNRELSLFRLGHVDFATFKELLKYGLPLTITFALGFIVSGSDRLLLGWMRGTEEAGLYAVGYDLTQFTIGMLMMIVNLAGYPLVVRALEREGLEAAREKLKQNGLLLVAIAFPASAGLVVLSENISRTLLGPAFQTSAEHLIPLIALAALIAGISAYYFNLAFQLGNYTLGQVWVASTAAIANVLLNLWWIPKIGMIGAAYATIVAYSISLALSLLLGRRIFPMPPLHKDVFKVCLASVLMALVLLSVAHWDGALALISQIGLGIAIYVTFCLVFNVTNCQERLSHVIKTFRKKKNQAY